MAKNYQNALPQGTQLDTYRIEQTLGVGGFGITYLVRELNLGKLYAIKELLPDGIAVRQAGETTVMARSTDDEDDFAATRKYFISEARILAGMDHPAVVSVHRLMEAHGTCYMVMDYVEGDTLGDYLKRRGGVLSGADEFQQIFYPLMEGLEVLHGQGIIHRDIKPGNIMVKPGGSPVLLDFGAATQTQSQTITITQMLSAGYSPFEQYTSRAKQGPYTDIYALGATMYKSITGKKPDDASDRVYNDPYQPLAQNPAYLEAYGRELLGAVDVALRMNPEQRPQTVDAWRRVFEGTSEEAPIALQNTGADGGVGLPLDIPSDDAVGVLQEPLRTKPKSRKTALVATLTTIILLGAVGAILTAVLRDQAADKQQEEVVERQRVKDQELAEMERQAEAKRLAEQKEQEEAARLKREAEAKRLKEQKEREEAARLKREAEAKRLSEMKGQQAGEEKVVTLAGLSVKFRWCPPTGEDGFMMGSPATEKDRDDDEEQHKVVLTKGFWLMETEVTQGLWQAVMGNNPSSFKKSEAHPVEQVSWEDCQQFIKKVNAGGKLPEGVKAALPTEAQWEYACRAGTTGAYAGSGELASMGWYDSNSGRTTHPVRQKQANAWGLHDMHGNVYEWCADWYGDYGSSQQTDPTGAREGQGRVLRGGSWIDVAWGCRSANRSRSRPDYRSDDLGFRLSLQVENQ